MAEHGNLLLGGLGVSGTEEATYRALLRSGPSTLASLAERAQLSRESLRRMLPSLEELGLVSRLPGRPLRLTATPPGVALDALAARRQDEVASSRAAASVLMAEAAVHTVERPEELLEVVTGGDVIAQRFYQLHEAAQHQVLGLVKPPFAIDTSRPNVTQEAAMRRGVTVRCIYCPTSFDSPSMLANVQRATAHGEIARIADIPTKLTVIDDKFALLPLTSRSVTVESALIVHSSALLDALISLFEVLWRTAAPLDLATATPGATHPDALEQDMVSLLASGMQDDAVARQLGISTRTLQRKLQALFTQLDSRTRFQAGFRAASRQHQQDRASL
ncbi:helix-turn-helix domain-containing protein [Ornithinimicrobium sufpigmenti]|uniref:helix-turn-helix domain-containing protein n=1 Tax=Ornithinimicrobium sufpigmenti TaxID=2508882 RepID=UPI0010364332|nr:MULTISPECIES: helix-turn-helix domain-containing protein [unclassified Ornithinimicrobium]